MQIRQFLYFGLASRNLGDSDLVSLLEDSRERNITHDVTGLLIYVGNYFIQHIEGPPSAIEQLAHNIEADNRINDFTILIDEIKTERMFPDWRMGLHTQATANINQQTGFVNISDSGDFDDLIPAGPATQQIIKKFYNANKGAPLFF